MEAFVRLDRNGRGPIGKFFVIWPGTLVPARSILGELHTGKLFQRGVANIGVGLAGLDREMGELKWIGGRRCISRVEAVPYRWSGWSTRVRAAVHLSSDVQGNLTTEISLPHETDFCLRGWLRFGIGSYGSGHGGGPFSGWWVIIDRSDGALRGVCWRCFASRARSKNPPPVQNGSLCLVLVLIFSWGFAVGNYHRKCPMVVIQEGLDQLGFSVGDGFATVLCGCSGDGVGGMVGARYACADDRWLRWQ